MGGWGHSQCWWHIYISDLLVEAALAGADILQAFGQLIKIIATFSRILQSFIIQRKAFDDVFLEFLTCPLAKPHPYLASDPVTQGKHHIQVVMGYFVLFAIRGSCSE